MAVTPYVPSDQRADSPWANLARITINLRTTATSLQITREHVGVRVVSRGGDDDSPVVFTFSQELQEGDEGLIRWASDGDYGRPVFVKTGLEELKKVGPQENLYNCIDVPGGEIHWWCASNPDGNHAYIEISGTLGIVEGLEE